MTKDQIKKLDTIIGKLEALQREVDDSAGDLGMAKTYLIRVLNREAR